MNPEQTKSIELSKEQFDLLSSDVNISGNNFPCPACKKFSTKPHAGCDCRVEVGHHIMKYHHSCQ